MISNYFKIAIRNLLKNRIYSLINIGGLAVGIAGFLMIIQYVRFERSYEDFHRNADQIVRLTTDLYRGSEYMVTDCETYTPLGPMLKEKMPEVLEYTRLMNTDHDQEVKVADQKFFESRVYYADPSVFKTFTFPILQGDVRAALSSPNLAVISESIAKKYFGKSPATGQLIEVGSRLFKISAVMKDVPPNTHLKLSILLSHSTIPTFWTGYGDDNWHTGNNDYTYLLLRPGTDLVSFNDKVKKFSADMKTYIGSDRFSAQRIKDIHLYSDKTFEPESNGNAKTVYFLLIISVFIIFLAWVNYINLSTARAVERAREVGIRKVMGSIRRQLIVQFLSESLLVNVIAIAIGLLIMKVAYPSFRDLSGQPISTDIFTDYQTFLLVAGLLMCGVLLAGIYPALVLSSFNPTAVLKGKFTGSGHGQVLRKGLVVFQFAATSVLIICLATVYAQVKFMRNYDLGMNIDRTVVVRAPEVNFADSANLSKFHSFKNELLALGSVTNVSRSGSMPGADLNEVNTNDNIFQYGADKNSGSFNYYNYYVDDEFFTTLSMKLVAGRDFTKEAKNEGEVIINEESVLTLGFKSPEDAVGGKITYHSTKNRPYVTIVGVVKNFYQRSPKEKQIPMIFRYSDDASYFSLKLNNDNVRQTVDKVKGAWDHVFPSTIFSYYFLDEHYNRQYRADTRFGNVMATFSFLAIFIACLGLSGLSAFTIVQRTKEIGIRKVLGGSAAQITGLLSIDFIKLIAIAGLVAMPFAFFAMREWLARYTVRIEQSAWIFILPFVIILFIALTTVSFQTIRAAKANPVNSLKFE